MNKKLLILLLLFLIFNIFLINSIIIRPHKYEEVGAIIGRLTISETSWLITLYLKNNDTGEDYIINPRINGYYFLLNLKPGSYSLYKFDIKRTKGDYSYWANGLLLGNNGITIIVEPNKIVPVNFLEISILYNKYKVVKDNIYTDDYINDLKSYFEGLDKKGFWKDFEWSELKTGNDLITEKM